MPKIHRSLVLRWIRGLRCGAAFGYGLIVLGLGILGGARASTANDSSTNLAPVPERSFIYYRDVVAAVPWSIHVIKIARADSDLVLHTTLGRGPVIGMGTVSDQLRFLTPALGRPLAAVNGDFYDNSERYRGRPRDLQIRSGEVVSQPAGHACFWIDPSGAPRITNVISRFRVVWPDGSSDPIGLNEEREADAVVLYTAVVGRSTRTRGGLEWTIKPTADSAPLPLRPGETYRCQVSSSRKSGDSPVNQDVLVLSMGPDVAARLRRVDPGTNIVQIITETFPSLAGVQTAIAGGPTLVRGGKAMEWSGLIQMRHPRTALGWDAEFIYLVEVDGRQGNLSVGMTFPELANYMVRLGCQEAMNLDGGGSATVWVLGTVVNSPSEGQERPGANALVVLKKGGGR